MKLLRDFFALHNILYREQFTGSNVKSLPSGPPRLSSDDYASK
jgi:hypothetical protein